MPQMRVLPTEVLIPDPDVQIEHTLEQKRVEKLSANWNNDYVVVLVVVPLPFKGGVQKYGIIDGRHRFLAGSAIGVKEWRCDIHADVHTVAEKAKLKLAIDRDRRRVTPLEHFLERVKMEDPVALDIQEITVNCGYDIGKLNSGKPYGRIESTNTLDLLYKLLGPGGLRKTLVLNTKWLGDPKSNTSNWLRAMGLLVRDEYDQYLTPTANKRLAEMIPAKVLRQAAGELELSASAGGNVDAWGNLAYAVAKMLRRSAKMKPRPAKPGGEGRGHKSYPL